MKCRSVGVSGMFLRIISGTLIQIIKKVSKGESKETLPGGERSFDSSSQLCIIRDVDLRDCRL